MDNLELPLWLRKPPCGSWGLDFWLSKRLVVAGWSFLIKPLMLRSTKTLLEPSAFLGISPRTKCGLKVSLLLCGTPTNQRNSQCGLPGSSHIRFWFAGILHYCRRNNHKFFWFSKVPGGAKMGAPNHPNHPNPAKLDHFNPSYYTISLYTLETHGDLGMSHFKKKPRDLWSMTPRTSFFPQFARFMQAQCCPHAWSPRGKGLEFPAELLKDLGGSIVGLPLKTDGFFNGNSPKWMMTGGSPVLGTPHLVPLVLINIFCFRDRLVRCTAWLLCLPLVGFVSLYSNGASEKKNLFVNWVRWFSLQSLHFQGISIDFRYANKDIHRTTCEIHGEILPSEMDHIRCQAFPTSRYPTRQAKTRSTTAARCGSWKSEIVSGDATNVGVAQPTNS